jgi:hypothetical protein
MLEIEPPQDVGNFFFAPPVAGVLERLSDFVVLIEQPRCLFLAQP